jgi:hypothetical protein
LRDSEPAVASTPPSSCGSRRTYRWWIEIADEAERIERFLPVLDEMITEGLVTLERVRVILYRHRPHPGKR